MNLFRKNILLFGLAVGLFLSLTAVSGGTATALSGSEFKAGRIIDDSLFYNGSTMSATEIQNFLNAKVPSCDTLGQKMYDSTQTRAQYSESKGYFAPYTCLGDYKQDTGYKGGESGICSAIEAKTGRTAGQIIDDVARACNISQKVLLVMLQKEQGLITDDWPWSIQYDKAMGFYCPDNPDKPGWCHPDYAGFFNQVYNAARQFQRYKADPNNWNHVPFMTNQVLYQANAPSCGSRSTYIENYATAGLYNYTPYTPNQAALDNLYGTGDDCSAYGNRNFWRYYSDWFGSTHNPVFSWQVVSLNLYDEGKNTQITTDQLHAGERLWASLKVKNVGTVTWYRDGVNPITLGVDNPRDHNSKYCDTTWISCNRVGLIKEASVAPGDEGHFEFYFAASNITGEFREYLTPLLENKSWMLNNTGFHIYSQTKSDYAWQWSSYDAWTDPARTTKANMTQLTKNQTIYVTSYAKNTSATVWQKDGPTPLRLATSGPKDRTSILCDASWLSCNRIATMNESTVLPGQTASFSYIFRAPSNLGDYREYVRPVMEFKGWTAEDINHIYMKVTQ